MPRQNASPPADASGEQNRRFHAEAFSLAVADGWRDDTVYRLRGPNGTGPGSQIDVTVDPSVKPATAADYAAQQLDAQASAPEQGTVLRERPLRLHCGEPAYDVRLFRPAPSPALLQALLFVVADGAGYRLSYIVPVADARTAEARIDRVQRSFVPETPLRCR
jgi:hypothetical protein